ncbi:hypothetical protein HELRODRAFT_183655 [Helobdella robusta]|uniref:B box-type domain-containing protein n=1 Tax=Helobdella robusta TaxID=6412 RepID=T1FK01_HELRO|nr:hypothetical protein HELRODRAFT_183655 [Helobdella robusta]ESO10433.1 hypothetical protein HELRODRAFT_183655 [Helobdella robusta]
MSSSQCSFCNRNEITKILPCRHSNCLSCLELFSENSDNITCLTCQKSYGRPEDLYSIPNNEFGVRLEKVVRYLKNDGGFCKKCLKNPAKKYCMMCKQTFCFDCLDLHNEVETNKSHDAFDVELFRQTYVLNRFKYRVCAFHDQDVDIYCKKCDGYYCSKCFIHGHKTHEFVVAEAKVKEEKKNLESEIEKRKVILDQVVKMISELNTNHHMGDLKLRWEYQTDPKKAEPKNNQLQLMATAVEKFNDAIQQGGHSLYKSANCMKEYLELQILSLEKTSEFLSLNTIIDYKCLNLPFPNYCQLVLKYAKITHCRFRLAKLVKKLNEEANS